MRVCVCMVLVSASNQPINATMGAGVCLYGAGLGDNCCLDRTYGGWDVFAITAYLTNVAAFVMAKVAGCVCAHILLDRRQVDNILALRWCFCVRWVFLRPVGVLRRGYICTRFCLPSVIADGCVRCWAFLLDRRPPMTLALSPCGCLCSLFA